jgi:phosphoribosylanthranilate isomerase
VRDAAGVIVVADEQDVRFIIAQQKRTRVDTIQLCDRLEAGSHTELREALPGVRLVQVIHVRTRSDG